jgi:hypothetical protein
MKDLNIDKLFNKWFNKYKWFNINKISEFIEKWPNLIKIYNDF